MPGHLRARPCRHLLLVHRCRALESAAWVGNVAAVPARRCRWSERAWPRGSRSSGHTASHDGGNDAAQRRADVLAVRRAPSQAIVIDSERQVPTSRVRDYLSADVARVWRAGLGKWNDRGLVTNGTRGCAAVCNGRRPAWLAGVSTSPRRSSRAPASGKLAGAQAGFPGCSRSPALAQRSAWHSEHAAHTWGIGCCSASTGSARGRGCRCHCSGCLSDRSWGSHREAAAWWASRGWRVRRRRLVEILLGVAARSRRDPVVAMLVGGDSHQNLGCRQDHLI